MASEIQHTLSERGWILIDREYTASEIHKAIFDMAPTKAPGIDGLLAIFYQKYWDTVGDSVTKACLSCLNDGESFEPVNKTLITLILKSQQVEYMSNFHPISLCNVTYKIVAKTLANRLYGVMGEVISDNQSAFIPG
ncbi:hypothetical protein Ddye_012026 [Dipteronia dyeriana]|uniref:Reverse transcriptase domain-containing protein n=1 Tax=Dipteronia dyeriana TaxID=168575 RepID=A0AAD9X3K2_9ROSI|nr:hypothetical protein Ddye_012026 [Dipteronia dyeriana]